MFDRIFKVNIWNDVFFGQESCLKGSQRISCPDSEIASWHGINVRISLSFLLGFVFSPRTDKFIPYSYWYYLLSLFRVHVSSFFLTTTVRIRV